MNWWSGATRATCLDTTRGSVGDRTAEVGAGIVAPPDIRRETARSRRSARIVQSGACRLGIL